MKAIFSFLASLIIVISFSSCQKEVNGVINNDTKPDSTYLSKMIIVDTTLPTGTDTTHKSLFKYDNLKRLSSILNFTVGGTDTVKEEFFYIGTDTLPYKQVYHDLYLYSGSAVYFRDTIFHTYSNGIIIKDSTIEWEVSTNTPYGADVSEFTNLVNGVVEKHRNYDYVSGIYTFFSQSTDTLPTSILSGNIVAQTDPTPGYFKWAQVVYDNKINPYYNVAKVHYPIFWFFYRKGWDIQKSNPINIKYEHGATIGSQREESISYTYRNDNYPIASVNKNLTANSYTKTIYFYTSL